MKIKHQLIIFFSAVILVSIGVSAIISVEYTTSGIIDSEIQKMYNHNNDIMHEIETLHSRASEDLVFALQNPKFVEYFELPETKAGDVYDENGVMQFTDKQRQFKEDLEQWIYHFQNKFDVDETCIIDASGQEHARLVLTKIETDENLSPDEEQSSFFEPSFMLQKNEVHLQYPYVSPDTNRWVFAYTSPVELGNGQKPAFFHFEMPLSVFANLLHSNNGRMYVLDPNGFVVADTYNLVSDTVVDFSPEKNFPPFQSVFADDGASEILDEMKSNDIGQGTYFVNGEEHYFVYEKLSTFDWILVYDKPVSLMLSGSTTVNDLIMTIGFIAAIVSGLGILGIIIISSRISRPITKLADEISCENPERLEELHAPNHEVGQISRSVNTLLDKITKNQEDIHLQNQELKIQKQQLERLARIGELTSRLSHNLRTPLTVIKMAAYLLKNKSENLDESSAEKLEKIITSSENLEKQIEDVLVYIRNKPLVLKDLTLEELVNDTLKNIQVPENVQIKTTALQDCVRCDVPKLQNVLMNIIMNAIEAVDEHGTITIDSSSTDDKTTIKIIDDGPGIPEENINKIFDSLFTTKANGTGLGLPYCKSIIEEHDGTISVSLNPTTFTISLPRKTITRKSE